MFIASFLFAAAIDTYYPPARYDRPYEGDLVVMSLHPKSVVPTCSALFDLVNIELRQPRVGAVLQGCAVYRNDSCIVVIPDRPVRGRTPEQIKRHEIGHCNGWPADHLR